MKKYFVLAIALLVLFAMSLTAFAEATGGVVYKNPNILSYILGPPLDHDHQYTLEKDRPELELGIIGELIAYRGEFASVPFSIGAQSQYVWETGDWGIYGKVIVDISPLTDKLISGIGNLFDR